MIRRACFSDIDGTLSFHDLPGHVRLEDRQAIAAFRQTGGLFGVCSGRPLCGLKDLDEAGVICDFYILVSGAVILDRDRQVISETPMDLQEAQALFEQYRDQAYIIVQTDRSDALYTNVAVEQKPSTIPIQSLHEIEAHRIYGISLVVKTEEEAAGLTKAVNQNPSVEGFQNANSVDIVKRGCSKGKAVTLVKEYFQIDKTAGIGDSYNDLPMLEAVDAAFTFVDSPDSVKQKARHLVEKAADLFQIW